MAALLLALLKFAGLMAVAAGFGVLIGAAIASIPWFKRTAHLPPADGDPGMMVAAAGLYDAHRARHGHSRREPSGDGGESNHVSTAPVPAHHGGGWSDSGGGDGGGDDGGGGGGGD